MTIILILVGTHPNPPWSRHRKLVLIEFVFFPITKYENESDIGDTSTLPELAREPVPFI